MAQEQPLKLGSWMQLILKNTSKEKMRTMLPDLSAVKKLTKNQDQVFTCALSAALNGFKITDISEEEMKAISEAFMPDNATCVPCKKDFQ